MAALVTVVALGAAVGLLLTFAVLVPRRLGGHPGRPAGSDAIAVPAMLRQAIASGGASCPQLTPPRLAGQLMATSRFDPAATRRTGGQGIAGLTDQEWQRWSPWPGAQRSDGQASIPALAHEMCDLAASARSAKPGDDPWRSALSRFAAGPGTVTRSDQYVDAAAAYATRYADEPRLGLSNAGLDATPKSVPAAPW